MITRGIEYHTIDDIKKLAYRTIQAGRINDLDVNELLSRLKSAGVEIIKKTTSRSSLFIGNFDIFFVSKSSVENYFKIRHLEDALTDIMIEHKSDYVEEIDELRELIFSEDYSENSFHHVPSYVIIFKQGDDKTPVWVGTSFPDPIIKCISDKRFYELDSGDVIISDDGLPLDIFYKVLENGEIVYSKIHAPGFLHIGQ